MTDLHSLAAACFEGDRDKAALILSLSDDPLALFARLDSSSKLALIGWGLHRRVTPPRSAAAGQVPLSEGVGPIRNKPRPVVAVPAPHRTGAGTSLPLAGMRASTASH